MWNWRSILFYTNFLCGYPFSAFGGLFKICSRLLLLHRESTLWRCQLTPHSSDRFPLYLNNQGRCAEPGAMPSNTIWAGQPCPLASSTAILVQAASPEGCWWPPPKPPLSPSDSIVPEIEWSAVIVCIGMAGHSAKERAEKVVGK